MWEHSIEKRQAEAIGIATDAGAGGAAASQASYLHQANMRQD